METRDVTSPSEPADVAALEGLEPRERELVDFARELVSTPSETGAEHAVSELLAGELARLGYRDIDVDGAGNVVGRLGEGSPILMFNGHIDHVPPAGMDAPFGATLEPGSRWGETAWAIRGRGSCDMKANVAAGAHAATFLRDAGALRGSYVFTADVQEETDSPAGLPALLERGVRARYGISGESTGLAVSIGHRGKLQAEVVVHGRASHASTPDAGVNAVLHAQPFLRALELAARALPAESELGPATLTVTAISSEPDAGVAVVPNLCVIRIDRRWIPEETKEDCVAALEALVRETAADAGVEAELRPLDIDYPLMHTPRDHPLVAAGLTAVADIMGRTPPVVSWRFGVNATFMNRAGIPSIGIGAGLERWAHTPEEHVPVNELVASARVYARLIEDLCRESGMTP